MATLLDLFNENKTNLYSSLPSKVPTSKSGKPITPKVIGSKNAEILIESKGLVNPARTAAVAVAQPSQLGDIITNNVAGLLTGITAKRPSDTIFSNQFAGPPITVNPLVSRGLDGPKAGKPYFVKTTSLPSVALGDLLSGNPAQAIGAAITSAQGILQSLRGSNTTPKTPSGAPLAATAADYKAAVKRGHGLKFHGPQPVGGANLYTGRPYPFSKTEDGKNAATNLFNSKIALTLNDESNSLNENFNNKGQTYIKIGVVTGLASNGVTTSYTLVFPGAISGISEDISPEINSFRYLGSPFKVHRYSGVERSLKFNFKLYYTTPDEKKAMIVKLNSLKELAFPYPEISEVKYGNDSQATQYAFTPNLIKLTITGLYEGLLGIVDSLSFNIEDNIGWAGDGTKDDRPYPTVIDVAFSMKVIENHEIKDNKFKYDFDKLGKETVGYNPFESPTLANGIAGSLTNSAPIA